MRRKCAGGKQAFLGAGGQAKGKVFKASRMGVGPGVRGRNLRESIPSGKEHGEEAEKETVPVPKGGQGSHVPRAREVMKMSKGLSRKE